MSGLWNVSDMMPSQNGAFFSKSKLILGLISFTFEFSELWTCVKFCLIGFGGVQRIGPGWKAASGIQGLLFAILSSTLFMECVGCVECMWFVFLVSIFVLPGIFCDKLDGWLIAWLMGLGLFLFDSALP